MTTLEHASVEPNVYQSKGEEIGVVTTVEEEDTTTTTAIEQVNDVVTNAPEDTQDDVAPSATLAQSSETLGSPSGSGSNSRQSSVRVIGASSAATSWTQVEEGERASAERSRGKDGGRGRGGTEVVTLLHPDMDVTSVQEEDIGEVWHPLRYDGKARLEDEAREGDKVAGEGAQDVGSAPTGGGTSDRERWRTFGRSSRHLRLEFKAPSPQPWDDIDPPADNNETYASDYYSTLNSKKFGTLQKSRRRPLIPHSTYYFGPPPPGSAYGTPPVGQLGVHHPREIVRIERDYGGGELVQFSPVFPLELEGRITPTQFHQTINDINEILISAHSIQHACFDNCLAVVTLQLSTLFLTSHYAKEMRRLKRKIEEQNTQLYNPAGLNILWPRKIAFLFLEIEYY